jgi:hypothetical protein
MSTGILVPADTIDTVNDLLAASNGPNNGVSHKGEGQGPASPVLPLLQRPSCCAMSLSSSQSVNDHI